MRKIHLGWIIPFSIALGLILGTFIMSSGQTYFYENYPVIRCIYTMESAMNVESNILPITKESQIRAIEYRCAIEFIPNITKGYELDDIWVIK